MFVFTSAICSASGRMMWPLSLQLAHLSLSLLWNLAGALLLSLGLPALGPTASLSAIPLMLIVVGCLLIGVRKLPLLYVATSILAGLTAAFTVVGAFTKDPALWPADGWRYGGVLINALGMTGALWGLWVVLLPNRFSVKSAD